MREESVTNLTRKLIGTHKLYEAETDARAEAYFASKGVNVIYVADMGYDIHVGIRSQADSQKVTDIAKGLSWRKTNEVSTAYGDGTFVLTFQGSMRNIP